MSFQNKYLKYKKKYVDLKNQIGGAIDTLPSDVMNNILESLTNKEIINRCSLNKIDCQTVSWSKLISDRNININSVLNLNEPEPTICQHITNPDERTSCRIFYNYTKYTKHFKTIAVSHYHSMALKRDGTIVTWWCAHGEQFTVPPGLIARVLSNNL